MLNQIPVLNAILKLPKGSVIKGVPPGAPPYTSPIVVFVMVLFVVFAMPVGIFVIFFTWPIAN